MHVTEPCFARLKSKIQIHPKPYIALHSPLVLLTSERTAFALLLLIYSETNEAYEYYREMLHAQSYLMGMMLQECTAYVLT